jgi:hypothetical protein
MFSGYVQFLSFRSLPKHWHNCRISHGLVCPLSLVLVSTLAGRAILVSYIKYFLQENHGVLRRSRNLLLPPPTAVRIVQHSLSKIEGDSLVLYEILPFLR